MKEFNMTSLRERLEELSTPQLDAMLRAELEKEPPDEYAARLILKVLRDREKDCPLDSSEQIDRAWKEYKDKTTPKKIRLSTGLLRVASVLIVIGALMLMLPQEANARNFFDRIVAWTDSIFELFSPSDFGRQKTEYEFRTDHPGLQELYDTVTELGVTVPVVPMWLPEGHELVECKVGETPTMTTVSAFFLVGSRTFVYRLNILKQNISREYQKNECNAEKYESNGIIHNIIQNENLWSAVWIVDNLECSVAADCQEDVFYKILDSIYTMEG